jgi:hypothetical protein
MQESPTPVASLTSSPTWRVAPRPFRRRLRLAAPVALVLGIVAAGVAWAVIPINRTAYTLLVVRDKPPYVVYVCEENSPDLDLCTRTQMALMESQPVLEAAIRPAEISSTAHH